LNLSFQEHVGRKVHGKPKKSRKIAKISIQASNKQVAKKYKD
jgi:hypothetical protein